MQTTISCLGCSLMSWEEGKQDIGYYSSRGFHTLLVTHSLLAPTAVDRE